jgi:hypothetical protein
MTGKELVDYKGLKALGIRYSKVHLGRLEEIATFPKSFKLAEHRNSPRVSGCSAKSSSGLMPVQPLDSRSSE